MDEQENKITVSMRKAIAGVQQNISVGSVYNATVTAVGSLGIFCELDCGVTGLVHISMVSSACYYSNIYVLFLRLNVPDYTACGE